MTIKIAELMAKRVVTATPHQSVSHVRELMARRHIHAIPIVGPELELLGIVSGAQPVSGPGVMRSFGLLQVGPLNGG